MCVLLGVGIRLEGCGRNSRGRKESNSTHALRNRCIVAENGINWARKCDANGVKGAPPPAHLIPLLTPERETALSHCVDAATGVRGLNAAAFVTPGRASKLPQKAPAEISIKFPGARI